MHRRKKRRRGALKSSVSRGQTRRHPTIESLESRQLLTSDTAPFGYIQVALAADQSSGGLVNDATLQNAWGLALAPGGGPLWVADNTTGDMSRFQGDVSGSPFVQKSPNVSLPAGQQPTAITFNQTSDFTVGSGATSGPALFLIASQNGEIDGWNAQMGSQAQKAVSGPAGAEFTGLAVANDGTNSFLYAADFHNGKIDVFDKSFNATTLPANAFTDSSLPSASYAPYNIQLIGSQLYVTYAVQDNLKQTPVPGAGNGAIAVYNLDGSFVKQITNQGAPNPLNVPDGLAVAPASFGDAQGDLLVANSGDGHILAYNSSTGIFQFALNSGPGSSSPMTIPGVRGLAFGNASPSGGAGEVTTLFYSAASGGHSQLGEIRNAFDQTLVVVPTTFSTEQGQSFTGPVAAVSDSNANLPAGSFTAQINWGDGTSSSTGSVVSSSAGFDILGTHTYPTAGVRQVTVTVVASGSQSASATATANIVDSSFTATGTSVMATQGANFSGSVGSFDDPTGPGTADSYVANINWGDGSTSAGNITLTGANAYEVTGNHVYSQVGSFSATATVAELNGTSTATVGKINSTATAADPNHITATASPISVTQGTATTATVATFTDTNAAATADIFTATINWGEGGSTSAGSVSLGADHIFTVTGSHAYVANGVMTVSVSVNDMPGTASTSATSTANVADGNTFTARPMTFVANTGQNFAGTVATFADANPLVRASDFSATIDWGDGNSGAGSVTAAGGILTVSGSHTYTGAGLSEPVTVTISEKPPSTGTASSTTTSTAVVPKGDVTGTGGTFTSTASVTGSSQMLASFSANTGNNADHFVATIDWGDGSSFSEGTVTTNGSGGFNVTGSHIYAIPGNFTPDVIVYESTAGGSATPAAAILATANVASPVVLTAGGLTATEHVTTSFTVATFTEANASEVAGDFAATIDWGDGSTASGGSISLNGGVFTVTGSHSFAEEGPFNVHVTVAHTGSAAFSNSITASANISEGDNFTAGVASLSTTKNAAFSGTVAIFTDADTTSPASDFSAVITWGDGTVTAGSVTAASGHFTVSGSHTYSQDGSFPFSVAILDKSGLAGAAENIATVNAIVSPGSAFTASPSTVTGTEGQSVSGAVATFVDTGSTSPATSFTAMIDWGDGTSATSATMAGGSGSYTVTGSHTYADEGSFPVTVRITQTATSAIVSATSTAAVSDADVITANAATIAATTGGTFTGTVATFTDTFAGAAAGDFTATIDWGDGTTTTTVDSVTGSNGTFTVSGSHSYSQTGSDMVKVTLFEDNSSTAVATATSTASVKVAATASISGEVFNDLNVNGQLDVGEPGLSGRTVFLNNDGTGLPGSNPSTTTDANGNFSFPNLPAGNYTVMEVVPAHGVTLSTPIQTIPLTVGQKVSGLDIGDVLTSTILPMPVTTSPPPATSDANTAYINAVYKSVLDHAPDAAGLAYWQQQLAAGADRSVVAMGVWNSEEHRGLEVDQFYQEYLGRAAEPAGRAYWIALFDSWGDEQIDSACFQISPEFLALHLSNKSFVDALYNDVDLRPADSAGETFWINQLAGGESQGQVALDFVFGQEASTQLIDGFYSNYLHHAPDSTSLQNWLNVVTQRSSTADQVAIQILSSDEYYRAVTANRAASITSAASTTFTAGTPGTFTVTTSGIPIGTISESGAALPSGVTFKDNGDGTATLVGTPAAGTGGTYALSLTAGNSAGGPAKQNFVLTVDEAASVSSNASTSFTENAAGSFKIQTAGFPKATISETGTLPSGVTLVDNHDGTATLAGTPAAGTANSYPLTITASNGVGTAATQPFTLTIKAQAAPAFTSANNASFVAGTGGTFMIAASGSPAATITETDAPPTGVSLGTSSNGSATLTVGSSAVAGTYTLHFKADNGVGAAATQSFTLTINAT